MANELQAHGITTGKTLYAVRITSTGLYWNGATHVAYNAANWTTYAIALTEIGAGSYMATMPTAAAGVYAYPVYEQAGASPAVTDAKRGIGSIGWNGAIEILPVNILQVSGTAQTARDLGLALPAAAPGGAGGLALTGAVGVAVAYAPNAAITNTGGGAEVNTYTALAARDGVEYTVREVNSSPNNINITITRTVSTITETPSVLRVAGWYNASGSTHWITVLAWDYLQAVPGFVAIGTMLPRASAFDYVFPLGVANHNAATGEMKIQFLHNAVTGNTSHYLQLDYVSFEKMGTSSALSGDVAAIRAKTDQLGFNSGNLKADIQMWLAAAPLALSSQQVQAVVPDTQKVDVNTMKAKGVTVDTGGTTFPATVGSGTSTFAGGAVASVTGDVGGKVLGGGISTITGIGAWVAGAAGAAVALVGSVMGKSPATLDWTADVSSKPTIGTGMAGEAATAVSGLATATNVSDAVTAIKKWLRLMFRKDPNIKSDYATELADINANTGAGVGTVDNTTDSLEARADLGLSAQAKLDVNAEADSALTDYGANKVAPPTADDVAAKILVTPANKLATDGTGRVTPSIVTAAAPTTADIKTALEVDGGMLDHLHEMTEDDGGVRRLTANALEQAPTGGVAPTVGQIDTQLSTTHGPGVWGAGVGVFSKVYTATVDGVVAAGVYCRLCLDTAGTIQVDAGLTNSLGQVTFHHNIPVGTTVYVFPSKDGVEFSFGGLPYDTEVV